MDKRHKRNETSDKKDDKIKDRGDLTKVNDKVIKKNYESTQVGIKVPHPERGDSERKISTNQKPEKMRINIVVKKPTNEESKSKKIIDGAGEKEFAHKKKFDKEGQDEFELRKRIRDKYTLKLKSLGNKSDQSNSILNKKDHGGNVTAVKSDGNKPVDRPKKQLTEEITQTKEKPNHSSTASTKTDLNPDKKSEKYSAKADKFLIAQPVRAAPKPERNTFRRKPLIKTIMSNSGPVKIYKAVTFVEEKRTPTPLEINIPAGDCMKKQKVSKYTDTTSLTFKTKATFRSRTSINEKPAAVRKKTERRRDKKKHVPSPDRLRENLSPPTEVARWAPASIDRQTKPYYEAWVDTTLAAISRGSKKDKLFYEKQRENILRSFQRTLEERPRTPELFYNFADENFTGRIKVTQR